MAVKALDTLIRLHKRRADALQKELRRLEDERQQLVNLSQKMQEEYLREIELAAQDAHISAFFGAYSQRIHKRQQDIAKEVLRLDKFIEAKAEAIRDEYAEQKKYEIARAHMMGLIASKERQRDQTILNEIGSQQYLKLQENVL